MGKIITIPLCLYVYGCTAYEYKQWSLFDLIIIHLLSVFSGYILGLARGRWWNMGSFDIHRECRLTATSAATPPAVLIKIQSQLLQLYRTMNKRKIKILMISSFYSTCKSFQVFLQF